MINKEKALEIALKLFASNRYDISISEIKPQHLLYDPGNLTNCWFVTISLKDTLDGDETICISKETGKVLRMFV